METCLLHVCKYRRCIAQFRVSSHRLRIETGRHQKPKLPLEQRLCQYCDKLEIDDERHLFESCKFHAQEQLELSNSVQIYLHETYKVNLFNLVMESTCSYVHNALGKFLYVCFYRRQIFMWYIFTYFKIIPFGWYDLILLYFKLILLLFWCCAFIHVTHGSE